MCYLIVERYSICRCLYYKHALAPCAAHGQRGHYIQEKTILVGYACSVHGGGTHYPLENSQDIVNASEDSDDSWDDEDSVFSGALAVSRATSFIASEGADTIDEIVHVLVNDPLLRWDNLLRHNSDDTEQKDVRFFLRAYELSLRAQADSNIERHTCTFLQSRLRYLSSKICERFQLAESHELGLDSDGITKEAKDLDAVALDEPDPTMMPSFPNIESFLFGGVAYEALKGNLRDFGHDKRDFLEEVVDIIARNIHPPAQQAAALAYLKPWSSATVFETLSTSVDSFVKQLAEEAVECKLSASDRIGTRNLLEGGGAAQIHAKLMELWDGGVAVWHFYPLISGDGKEFGCSDLSRHEESEAVSAPDVFRAFVCSSRALLGLASACMESVRKPSVTMSSMSPNILHLDQAMADRASLTFTCVSRHCSVQTPDSA